MAIAIEGTPVTTTPTATGSTATLNLPASIQAGELLSIDYIGGEPDKILVATGWTDTSFAAGAGDEVRVGKFWKIAEGDEGATVVASFDSGTGSVAAVAYRVSGFDAADPFNSLNTANGQTADINPFVLAGGELAGVGNDSIINLIFGAQASRTIVAGDADLTLIGSMTTTWTVHSLYEATPGSSSAAYSIVMSGSREYGWALFEIKATAAGGVSLTPPNAALVITGQAPTVEATANVTLTPAAAALEVTGLAATVAVSAHVSLVPGTEQLSITGHAPTVFAEDSVDLAPGTALLEVTGFAPTVGAGTTVQPGTATLEVAGHAPSVDATANVSLTPGTAVLHVQGHAPAVIAEADVSLVPGTCVVQILGFAPIVFTEEQVPSFPYTPDERDMSATPDAREMDYSPADRSMSYTPSVR